MLPSDMLKHAVVEGLGIDGDPRDRMPFQGNQFFARYGIGPSRLHRELRAIAHIKIRFDLTEQNVQLFRGKGSRRTAADVDGFEP